jgi:hypothetical protein
MLLPREATISAAPPQSPQYFVYTVRAGARACVTPITTKCGDCGGSQALRSLETASAPAGLMWSETGDEG